MKTFAVVEGGIVTNIIVGVEPEVVAANPTLYVEYTDANPAGIGWTYDGVHFIPVKPYPSWTLNTTTYQWQPPVAYPTDGKSYVWSEATTSWVLI